jgi:putative transcriptional regulator
MEQRYQLTGHILVSPPQIIDRRFQNSVIVMVNNSPAGSWGIVINKPMIGVAMSTVCANISIAWSGTDMVYAGGPIDPHGLHIIHSGDMVTAASQMIAPDIYVTSDIQFLNMMAQGHKPRRYRFFLGVCTWAPDQLEGEMEGSPPWTPEHRWLTAPVTESLIYDNEDTAQWQAAIDHCASYRIKDWMA